MAENKHTIEELHQYQALPLNLKIHLTMDRIKGWVDEFGEDGVYVSFSGGKDSTVLLDIVRNRCGFKNIPAMFIDVPTQFPELREFAEQFENVDIVKPRISFMQVCEKYGFPLISKEVSECVYGAKKYLTSIIESENALTDRQTDSTRISIGTKKSADAASMRKMSGGGTTESIADYAALANLLNRKIKNRERGSNQRLAQMLGMLTNDKENPIQVNIPSENRSLYSQEKYKFFLDADFEISNRCCTVMKKEPAHRYSKQTGRKAITAQMTSESRLRTQKWLQNGCNGFDLKIPVSNPMSFWTEQDVLLYIKENNLKICSVYGDVVTDYAAMGQVENQMSLADFGLFDTERPSLKCTGCQRTGCMLCGFGAHLEKEEKSRFQLLKETHPKMYELLDVVKNNGVSYREAIEWTNEHGNLNIRL